MEIQEEVVEVIKESNPDEIIDLDDLRYLFEKYDDNVPDISIDFAIDHVFNRPEDTARVLVSTRRYMTEKPDVIKLAVQNQVYRNQYIDGQAVLDADGNNVKTYDPLYQEARVTCSYDFVKLICNQGRMCRGVLYEPDALREIGTYAAERHLEAGKRISSQLLMVDFDDSVYSPHKAVEYLESKHIPQPSGYYYTWSHTKARGNLRYRFRMFWLLNEEIGYEDYSKYIIYLSNILAEKNGFGVDTQCTDLSRQWVGGQSNRFEIVRDRLIDVSEFTDWLSGLDVSKYNVRFGNNAAGIIFSPEEARLITGLNVVNDAEAIKIKDKDKQACLDALEKGYGDYRRFKAGEYFDNIERKKLVTQLKYLQMRDESNHYNCKWILTELASILDKYSDVYAENESKACADELVRMAKDKNFKPTRCISFGGKKLTVAEYIQEILGIQQKCNDGKTKYQKKMKLVKNPAKKLANADGMEQFSAAWEDSIEAYNHGKGEHVLLECQPGIGKTKSFITMTDPDYLLDHRIIYSNPTLAGCDETRKAWETAHGDKKKRILQFCEQVKREGLTHYNLPDDNSFCQSLTHVDERESRNDLSKEEYARWQMDKKRQKVGLQMKYAESLNEDDKIAYQHFYGRKARGMYFISHARLAWMEKSLIESFDEIYIDEDPTSVLTRNVTIKIPQLFDLLKYIKTDLPKDGLELVQEYNSAIKDLKEKYTNSTVKLNQVIKIQAPYIVAFLNNVFDVEEYLKSTEDEDLIDHIMSLPKFKPDEMTNAIIYKNNDNDICLEFTAKSDIFNCKTKIYCMTATPQHEVFRSLGITLHTFKVDQIENKGTVIQFVNIFTGSRSSLQNDDKRSQDFQTIMDLTGEYRNNMQVISYIEYNRELHNLGFEVAQTLNGDMNIFNAQGYNGAEGKNGLIIGKPDKNPRDYIKQYLVNYAEDDVNCEREGTYLRYNGVPQYLQLFTDEHLQQAELEYMNRNQEQAIGRFRTLRYADSVVFVFSNLISASADYIVVYSDNEELEDYTPDMIPRLIEEKKKNAK